MTDYEQPAIQNSTGVCFYCSGKLVDVAPPEVWEVEPDQRFIKVQCSNQECAGIAWRSTQQEKKTAPKVNPPYEDTLATPAKRNGPVK